MPTFARTRQCTDFHELLSERAAYSAVAVLEWMFAFKLKLTDGDMGEA